MTLAVPATVAAALGWDAFDQCRLHVGDGSDAGTLLIEPSNEGEFRFTRLKYSVLLRLGFREGWSERVFAHCEVKHEKSLHHGPGCVIVTLPKALLDPLTFGEREQGGVPAAGSAAPVTANTSSRDRLVIDDATARFGAKSVVIKGQAALRLLKLLAEQWGELVLNHDLLRALQNDELAGLPLKPNTLGNYITGLNLQLKPLSVVVTGAGDCHMMAAAAAVKAG